ncbi:hypothetical protein RhiirA5_421558 [Rhizophagus irregularis]|uniref:Uncharacterized protein n=1 Tax=Rhizophagus irregularis TaxID=588596 RepID=A0A2N0PDN1_9GLOM|nr:hypothetical protein RhiirA5_421558 [Rhizophagus irregularis]
MNITLVTLTFLNLLNLSLSTSFWIDFYLGFLLLPDYIIPTYITNLSAFKFFLHSVPNGLNGILYDLMNIYPFILDSKSTLLMDPSVCYTSITSFPSQWQQVYTLFSNVSAYLYDPVLAPEIISYILNNKASGPSKIS